MSKKCPKCGSGNILTERRLDGFHACLECLYRWKIGESQPKQNIFHQITASPEVLAPHFVREVCTAEGPHIVEKWVSAIVPDIYYETEAEAIAATAARLKEMEK